MAQIIFAVGVQNFKLLKICCTSITDNGQPKELKFTSLHCSESLKEAFSHMDEQTSLKETLLGKVLLNLVEK